MSPKQFAAKALFDNLQQYIADSKSALPSIVTGRNAESRVTEAEKHLDNIVGSFVIKMERLCKTKLGSSKKSKPTVSHDDDKADF